MAEEWDGAERRKYPRVPLKGEVKGKIHTVSAAPVIDLSVEGASLEVPCALEPKTTYTLRLAVGPTEQLEVKGKVIRSWVHSSFELFHYTSGCGWRGHILRLLTQLVNHTGSGLYTSTGDVDGRDRRRGIKEESQP